TKKPEDTQGVMATSTANQFGETTSQVRWGASTGKWTWRTSFGYQEYKSSEDVINHAHFESQDFAQRGQFDGEAKYKIDDQTKVSFGTGYQHARQGDYEFIGLFPNQEGRTETVRSFARVDHEFNSDFSGY